MSEECSSFSETASTNLTAVGCLHSALMGNKQILPAEKARKEAKEKYEIDRETFSRAS